MQYDNFRMSICVKACNIQFLLDLSSMPSTITANAVEFTRLLKLIILISELYLNVNLFHYNLNYRMLLQHPERS